MWGLHLKKRGDWWHYYRAIPVKFRDIEEKSLISFTLNTRDFSEAKLKAAQISIDLENEWQKAKERGLRRGYYSVLHKNADRRVPPIFQSHQARECDSF